MELINRNALLSGWTGMAFSGDSRQIILEQPIIDAVPVVRCKDCKYFEVDAGHTDGVMCLQRGHKWTIPKPNDFCSYAEKKA